MVERLNDGLLSTLKDKPFKLELQKNDTLIVEIDQDIFDINEAQELFNIISNAYPENKILCTFKGLKIKGIIHEM